MSLVPGTRLGPYEIVAPLGAGGMGEVYRARDTRLGREVAIKVLPAEVASDPERLRRFEQEAKAVSALNHPHIVTLYEVGESDSGPYLVLERIDGHSLRELLRDGALPVKRVLQLGAQIAEGLAKAHAAGIVHRDLKPENVMVTEDGFAKILDFGLAKLVYPELEGGAPHEMTTLVEKTASGMILGTLGYLSPEQAAGKPADFRADQFALGALLYELSTGERPFRRETTPESLAAVIRDEPEPLRAKNAALPPQLGWIVERCLAKDPNDRYASTRDLARDLADLRDHLSEILRAGNDGTQPGLLAPPRSWREALSWSIAALIAVGAVSLFLWQRSIARPLTRSRIQAALSLPPGLEPEFVWGVALSPDGSKFVFAASGSLWLRSLAELEPRQIPGSRGGYYPFWSPDSRTIGFFVGDRLLKIGVEGATPTVLGETPSPRGGSWNQQGVILVGSISGPLRRIGASGGPMTDALHLDVSQISQKWPTFLPDGRHFLFSAAIKDWKSAPLELMLGALDGGAPRPLGETWSEAQYAEPGQVLFVGPPGKTLFAQSLDLGAAKLTGTPLPIAESLYLVSQRWTAAFSPAEDGTLVFVRGSASDVSRFVWSDRLGRELSKAVLSGAIDSVTLSPDQHRALLTIENSDTGTYDLWEANLERGTRTRLTDTPDDEQNPFWSHDGRDVVYASRLGSIKVGFYRRPVDSPGAASLLWTTENEGVPCDLTHDGRWLLFVDRKTGATVNDLWLLPMAGGSPKPFLTDPYRKGCGAFSPDDRWVAYTSEESGQFELYVAPFPGPGPGRRTQVSRGSVAPGIPRWSPKGDELFYFGEEGKVLSVSVRGTTELELGEPAVLFEHGGVDSGFAVSLDGQRFARLLPDPQAPQSLLIVLSPWKPEEKP